MTNLLENMTALYTPEDIEYAQVMSGSYLDLSVDAGAFVCIAAWKDGKITGYWRPMVCFGPNGAQTSWFMDRIWSESQDIYYQDFFIDGTLSPISRFLLVEAYTATPYYTQVIDLSQSVEVLRHGLRKSYHSLVNKQERVEFCDIKVFQGIHEYVKQKTRPQESWDIQRKMNLLCCHDNGRCGVMFYVGPVWAYYASAAGENTHAAIWACLLELKQRGVKYCEMGEQTYGLDKAGNIAAYKRGFGGVTRVRLNLRKGTS
jgi:hypothetical protein